MENTKVRILFCDDELEVSDTIISSLKLKGYEVIESNSGKHAIETIKKQKIDIILMDYFMPNMSGEEAIVEIRKFNTDVIVILQTAYSGRKPALNMMESLNIQGYHDKTDGVAKLLLLIATAIKIRNQTEEIKILKKQNEERLIATGKLFVELLENFKDPINSLFMHQSAFKDGLTYIKERLNSGDKIQTLKVINSMQDKLLESVLKLNYIKEMNENLIKYNQENLLDIKFSIKELINQINSILKFYLDKNKCYLNVVLNIDEDYIINGSIMNLVQVVITIIMDSVKHYVESEEAKEYIIDLIVNYKEQEEILFTIKDYVKIKNDFIQKEEDFICIEQLNTIINKLNGKVSFSKENEGISFYIKIPVKEKELVLNK